MRYSSTILFAASAVLVLAAPTPLNINMGAYSPALVVGDGAIGFKDGTASVANLMNTLQGAATSGTTTGGTTKAAEVAPAAVAAAPAAASSSAATQAEATTLQQGMGKSVALPVVTHSEAEDISDEELEALEATVEDRRRSIDTDANHLAALARDIEGEEDSEKRDIAAADGKQVEKRQNAGFAAALAFATGALKTSPEVQLGTGEGGSGVGIIQKPAGATTNGTTKAA